MLSDKIVFNLYSLVKRNALYMSTGTFDVNIAEQESLDFVNRFKEFLSHDSAVLDYGCGIGRIEKHLSKYCHSIYGVDISKTVLFWAKRWNRKIENVHFVCNNGIDLRMFDNEMFDFCFLMFVFMHIVNEHRLFAILKEIRRVCKKNGLVYLQFANLSCPMVLEHLYNYANHKEMIKRVYYTQDGVKMIMEYIGFEVVRTEIVSDYMVSGQIAKDFSIWILARK